MEIRFFKHQHIFNKKMCITQSLEDCSPDAWMVWIGLPNYLELTTVIWDTEQCNSSLFPMRGSNIHVVLYIPWDFIRAHNLEWVFSVRCTTPPGRHFPAIHFQYSVLNLMAFVHCSLSVSSAFKTAHVFDLLMTFFNFLLCRAKFRVLRRVSLLFRTL